MNTRLGHYDIVEELGRGGMGVVYKGYESSLGRYVAIKVLSAAMAHDPVFVERFLREARAMAALNDPHIIQIYFIGQDEAQTFFVMEYIDGESLSDCLKREGRLLPADALKILLDTSQGLAAAHAQGVIHRDIKPGNIMINSRGVVKVGDFGIALANNDVSSKLTNTGAVVGTPGYLSPEVCLGKAVDQRSDIFALGIVLFEMLSARMPFQDESPLKLMMDVVQAATPDIREINQDVDEDVARILERMLAKDPVDRYQSCDQLNAELKKHPLVMYGGPLQLRPRSADAGSKATMIGLPTPATPGHRPRMHTPPPMVTSRTPTLDQPPPVSALAAASAMAQTEARTLPQITVPSRTPRRSLLVLAAVLAIAVVGWAIGRLGFGGSVEPVAQAPIQAVPAPASPAAEPVAANSPAIEPAAVNSSVAEPLAANSSVTKPAAATVAAIPTEAKQAQEKAEIAQEIAREAARKRKLAAAIAATERQSSRASVEADGSSEESVGANDSSEESVEGADSGGSRSSAAEARRRYLCRVQKKCD